MPEHSIRDAWAGTFYVYVNCSGCGRNQYHIISANNNSLKESYAQFPIPQRMSVWRHTVSGVACGVGTYIHTCSMH